MFKHDTRSSRLSLQALILSLSVHPHESVAPVAPDRLSTPYYRDFGLAQGDVEGLSLLDAVDLASQTWRVIDLP